MHLESPNGLGWKACEEAPEAVQVVRSGARAHTTGEQN